ncbi:GtrA family protein [Citrobacter sedlakii]|uniref:GtrA family protein n=1 Tax=Citrobacter sedlakii TaxID=67826 RepID=UPI0031387FDF
MWHYFIKYTSVGVINTLIHWLVFAVCVYAFHIHQALANFLSFSLAVSFSFYANARFTFRQTTTPRRYFLYVGFMGLLSFLTGWAAERCGLPPLVTLVAFSAISLICGFIYSRLIVFKDVQ